MSAPGANPDLHRLLSRLMQARRWPEALSLIDSALTRTPGDPGFYVQRARVLLAQGDRAQAIAAAEAALPRAAGQPGLLDALGSVFSFAGEQRRACDAYDGAVRADPGHAGALYNRAAVRRFLGDLEGAEQDYDAVIARRPADAEAYRQRAELRVQTAERNHVAELEQRLQSPPSDWPATVQLRYALAKEYEDLGAYDQSFAQLRQGARLRRQHMDYEVATDLATVEWIIEAFPAPLLEASPPPAAGPIFIVGLPRTGSTLVERILSSHSTVTAAGELGDFALALLQSVQTPGAPLPRRELVRAAARTDFAALGQRYLARAWASLGWSAPAPDRRFTDKMPLNYLYGGLILQALPQARIVHLTRHPMATCYAIYKTLFKDAYPFSYDLADLGAYYLSYRRLMDHWHRALPGRILDVSYEALVRDQEGESRRLLEFCGLSWEAQCLEFHRNPSAATTASAAQVRRPIYDSSVEQWRHYREALRSLETTLEAAGIPL